MLRGMTIGFLVLIFVFGCVAAAVAQVTDLSVVVTDSDDPVVPDSTVSFAVEVANAGPDVSPNPVILDIYLPMDVPVPWQEYLDADAAGRTAIEDALRASANTLADENIWNVAASGIYLGQSFNNACEGMVIQPQNLVVLAGDSGQVTYDATLPASGGVSGLAYDTFDGDRVVMDYGVGGCNSGLSTECADMNCLGPRLTLHQAVGSPVSVVNDGEDPTNDGCQPLSGFPVGHVALIDRGLCEFTIKAQNAVNAGASGVIIANPITLGSVTPTADSVMTMGCADASCSTSILTIPAGFVSYNAGEALKTAMNDGSVTVFMGVRTEEPEYKQTKAYIWESTLPLSDINPDNDRFAETTTFDVPFFADGFETGDMTTW